MLELVFGSIKTIVLVVILASFSSTVMSINTSCSYEEGTLLCEDYINLNTLSFNLTGPISRLILRPAKERRNSFSDELAEFFLKIKDRYADDFDVELENFVDFDIGFNPFNSFTFTNKAGRKLLIDNSVLEFKINGLEVFNCTSSLAITQQKLFAKFVQVHFGINTIYRERLCPVVFADAQLDLLNFNGIDFRENAFTFGRLMNGTSLFRSNVKRAEILKANELVLDSAIFSPDVFRETVQIVYESIDPSAGLVEIASDTFGILRGLRELTLSINNWETFVKTSNGEWYSRLNPNRTSGFLLHLIDQTSSYEFPDEDFCAFIQLTRVRNVTTKIDGKESLECSCTLAWLLLNSNKSMETPTTAECFLNSTTISAELQRECNFTNRVFECERARATTPRTTTTTTTTTRVVEQKPKQDTTTIIFGVIGGVVLLIMIGIVVFYVYRNRSKQQKKEVEKINLDEDVNIVKTNN